MVRSFQPLLFRWLIFLTVSLLSIPLAIGKTDASQWSEAELSSLVKRAYIYSFPVYEMYRTRWERVYNRANPGRADLNLFNHDRRLTDHTQRWVTTPNNDTLYSNAWLDLSQEPLVLSVPDLGGRYYSLAFMDFFTNNFAHVGRRVTGTKGETMWWWDLIGVGPPRPVFQ